MDPVGIGKVQIASGQVLNKVNDRIRQQWQKLAGRWDQKTICAKLATIRLFEAHCDGKAFAKLCKDDVAGFRNSMKASVELSNDTPLTLAQAPRILLMDCS